MRKKITRILCALLTAVTVLTVLPFSVSAVCAYCNFTGTLWAEAIHPHPYFYYCMNGCGNKQYTGSYMSKNNCAQCNPSITNCPHSGSWTNTNHPHETVCTGCCMVMNLPSYPYTCHLCCSSAGGHYNNMGAWTESAHQYGGYHDQYYTCSRCSTNVYAGRTYFFAGCTICNPPVVSSVSMYAVGPENTITSSGILATTDCPASYTVYAVGNNCNVTSIYYLDNYGRQVSVYGNSMSYTANSTAEFGTKTYYCTTSTGVSASIAVNFTYERRAATNIKWRSVGATIREIKLDGSTVKSGLSTFIEFEQYHDGLPESSYDTIANLIGTQNGKTYILVCSTVAEVYSTQSGATLATFDTYNQYDDLVNYAAWSSQTLDAFATAKVLNISYQAPLLVDATATWQTTDGHTLATMTAQQTGASKWIYPSESTMIGFDYNDWSGASGYAFKEIRWSGETSGSSNTQQTYSQSYSISSSPVSVTFICKEHATDGSITVNVHDGDTGQSITNPTVTCNSYTKRTNPSVFTSLPLDAYSLTATASGYDTGYGTATITSTEPDAVADIFLYRSAGTVTVNVFDATTGQPISGANISGSGSGITDYNGSITFNNMPFIGTHAFTASKSGYTSGSGSGTISRSDPTTTVTIYLTPEAAPIVTGNVTVYVRDALTYAVLPDAFVTGSGFSGITNIYGYTTFIGLPFGSHVFSASKSGYNPNMGVATITGDVTSPTITIFLSPITNIPTTGSVTVYVKDMDTGSVITGATVSGAGTSKTTNSSGYATFSGLSLSSYTFTASKSGYSSNTGSVSITETSTSKTITIYLKADTVTTVTGEITVYVRDAVTGAVIPEATVTSGVNTGTTNSAGYVKFTPLTLGSYTFAASKDGYYTENGSVTITESTPADAITIYLTPIPTTGTINITVKDADTGSAISGATVTGSGYSGTTDSSGKLTFSSIPFGSYTFNASKSGYNSGSATTSISATATTANLTIYLTKERADVGIEANEVNGTVYRGSTIIVSADVIGDSVIDFKPDSPLTVKLTAKNNAGTVFDTQTITAICPAGERNLVWFEVTIPDTPKVTFTFDISPPTGYTDTNTANNTSSKTVTTAVLPTRTTPDASFELDAPDDFIGSVYKTKTAPIRTWSVWEWNGGFVKNTYTAQLHTTTTLTPDATAVYKVQNPSTGAWTTRSGYGLNTEVTVELNGIDSTMFAGNAKVNAYYPEFNYTTSAAKSNMLDRMSENPDGYSANYALPIDTDSISGSRMHKTPIWYPDGEYSVKFEVHDLWTPAGVLTATDYAVINIKGSMYDDYYTQRN